MKRMLFNATYQEELRVASVEGQKLINFDIETTSKAQRRGNIYCGVITRVEPSLEACFVDYGTEKQGFLPFKEVDPAYLGETGRYRDYSKLVEGTKLIVQVEKDERGNKGAALTTYISLPGRYLVLMPNNSRSGGISRRIEGEERDELKAVLALLTFPAGMSVIARTAALGRVTEELQWDLNYLLKLWGAIKSAAQNHDRFLIYQESNLVIRSIRDHFSPDVAEILIDEENIYNEARNFMASIMPNYVEKIKFYHDDVQLFSRFQIEHQIESAYSRAVNLPSGGSIVVDHTEALTAIDVNSARANKGADIEATALATNLEAAEEIARQLRLRDLGGLVVVDFIDMENPRNQRDVENAFKQQLGFDRARIQMGKLSKFGLLELSRQRLQASLEESTTIACPRCSGIGVIRGIESIAVHILRIIQEDALKNANLAALHVQLPVEVATYLLNEKRDDVAAIENRMRVKIMLIPNVHIDSPHYKIKKISNDNYDYIAKRQSFNLVDTFEESQNISSNPEKKSNTQPQKAAVGNIVPNQPAPVIHKSLFASVFGKLAKIFKPAQPVEKKRSASGVGNKTADKNYSAGRNQSRSTQTNKVRPVTINKSNTKIQTVRPNYNKGTSQSAKANMPMDTEVSENSKKNNSSRSNVVDTKTRQNTNQNNTREPRVEAGRPRSSNVDLAVNQRENKQNHRNDLPDAANQAKPNRSFSEEIVTERAKLSTNNPIANTKADNEQIHSLKNNPLSHEVEQKQEKPRVLARNTIMDKVDLGVLELVATDYELAKTIKTPDVSTKYLKRHNDIIVEEYVKVEIDYELVETKHAN